MEQGGVTLINLYVNINHENCELEAKRAQKCCAVVVVRGATVGRYLVLVKSIHHHSQHVTCYMVQPCCIVSHFML